MTRKFQFGEFLESGKWSTCLKEFREIWEFWGVVRIWDLKQVVILMSISLVFMKRWTQSWVSPIDTTWGMQSMRSSRRLGWKKQSEECQLFCLPMQWDDFKILYLLCALLHVAVAKSVNSNRLKLLADWSTGHLADPNTWRFCDIWVPTGVETNTLAGSEMLLDIIHLHYSSPGILHRKILGWLSKLISSWLPVSFWWQVSRGSVFYNCLQPSYNLESQSISAIS